MPLLLPILIHLLHLCIYTTQHISIPEFEWSRIQYDRNTPGNYIPKNNIITSLSYYSDRLYFATPRYRTGVPFSVASLPLRSRKRNPILTAFPPDASVNPVGDCAELQNVHAIDVDPVSGFLWALDGLRGANFEVNTSCPPKIVVFDLRRDYYGRVVRTYEFPDGVVRNRGALLNDIEIKHGSDGRITAFMSDSNAADPGLVVYSWNRNVAWKLRDNSTMQPDAEIPIFNVNGVDVKSRLGINSVALSAPPKKLYYSCLYSYEIYSIDTDQIEDESVATIDQVETALRRNYPGDGVYVDKKYGTLYASLLPINGYGVRTVPSRELRVVERSNNDYDWIESFNVAGGVVRFLVNRLERYFQVDLELQDDDEIKFRVYRKL